MGPLPETLNCSVIAPSGPSWQPYFRPSNVALLVVYIAAPIRDLALLPFFTIASFYGGERTNLVRPLRGPFGPGG